MNESAKFKLDLKVEFEAHQIKSKERVSNFGEVFTNKKEVNAMLDLVKDESYRVDSRFLEPACGNGNFLIAILRRKLDTVLKDHNANQTNFEKYTFMAVASIYAIDIQEDNCEEARERMYDTVKDLYCGIYPDSQDSQFLDAIKFLLELNIILGNGLTGLRGEKSTEGPIVFSEFTFEGDAIIRKDFPMNEMIAHNQRIEDNKKVMSGGLFGMIASVEKEEVLKPIKEFKYDSFKEVVRSRSEYVRIIEDILSIMTDPINLVMNKATSLLTLKVEASKDKSYCIKDERSTT